MDWIQEVKIKYEFSGEKRNERIQIFRSDSTNWSSIYCQTSYFFSNDLPIFDCQMVLQYAFMVLSSVSAHIHDNHICKLDLNNKPRLPLNGYTFLCHSQSIANRDSAYRLNVILRSNNCLVASHHKFVSDMKLVHFHLNLFSFRTFGRKPIGWKKKATLKLDYAKKW